MPVISRGHPNLHWWLGLSKVISKIRPDIVILDEEPYSLVAGQVLWARRRIGFGLIIYSVQNIYKRFPPPFSWIEKWSLRYADGFAAVNPTAAEVLRRKGAAGPIHLVPHAIPPQLYTPGTSEEMRRRLELRGFVIGYVGRLVPEKGVQDLLTAAKLLKSSAGEQFSVLIVGDGPSAEQLRSYANKHLPGQVVFVGQVPHEQVPQYYRCMDVLVLPSRTTSRWCEQFGRTLIEAQACGVPVVGSDSGAIPTTIAMTAGLVFPEGDTSALAELLRELMADENKRRSLAYQGRQRVLERFSDSAVASALYELILQVHAESKNGTG